MNKRPQVTSDSLFANNTVFPARIAPPRGHHPPVMDDAQSAERLRTRLQEHGCRTEVLSGQQAAAEVGSLSTGSNRAPDR
jgi:hypothetical protein